MDTNEYNLIIDQVRDLYSRVLVSRVKMEAHAANKAKDTSVSVQISLQGTSVKQK